MENSSIDPFHSSNLGEAIQLINNFEDYTDITPTQDADFALPVPYNMMKNENVPELPKSCFYNDDFMVPDIPDDANDDFSWLFKVLPPEGNETCRTVPTRNSAILEQTAHYEAPPPAETTSMLVDPMFSEMDVTSLISLDDVDDRKVTFYRDDRNNGEHQITLNDQKEQILRRRNGANRLALSRIRDTSMIVDTPISLRRSQRKRSYQQMIDAEVASDTLTVKIETGIQTTTNTKRRKMELKSKRSQPNPVSSPPKVISKNKELKIVLRKQKPVNPIDRKLLSNRSYQRGLIDPKRTLAGEIYLKHTMPTQTMAILDEGVPSIVNEKPIVPKRIMDLLKVEWITNHNTIANAKAHGKEMLGGKKLTPDGSAIRGAFLTMDLDDEYEKLLQNQNSSPHVINWKEKQKRNDNPSELEKSLNLESTFVDFSNFKNFFNDDDNAVKPECSEPKESTLAGRYSSRITGAVHVNTSALSENSTFSNKWAIFRYKGQFYRPNPAVITIQKVPDHVLEEMKSKPRKVTLQSAYYNALTSYFERKSNLP